MMVDDQMSSGTHNPLGLRFFNGNRVVELSSRRRQKCMYICDHPSLADFWVQHLNYHAHMTSLHTCHKLPYMLSMQQVIFNLSLGFHCISLNLDDNAMMLPQSVKDS